MTEKASENTRASSSIAAPRTSRQAGGREASSCMAACPVSSATSLRASSSVGRQRAGRGTAGSSSSAASAMPSASGGCGAAKPSRRASASDGGKVAGAVGGNASGVKRRRPTGGGRKRLLDALEARLDALTEGLAAALVAEKGIDMVKEIKELYAMLDALRGEGMEKERAAARVLVVWGEEGSAARGDAACSSAADAPAALEAAEARHD